MPERIQRRRTAGWRMPEGAIYVGRPTVYGNPFRPTRQGDRWLVVDDNGVYFDPWSNTELSALRRSVELFHWDLVDLHRVDDQPGLRDAITALAGHDLVCWCPLDQPCHADVLIELAAQAVQQ